MQCPFGCTTVTFIFFGGGENQIILCVIPVLAFTILPHTIKTFCTKNIMKQSVKIKLVKLYSENEFLPIQWSIGKLKHNPNWQRTAQSSTLSKPMEQQHTQLCYLNIKFLFTYIVSMFFIIFSGYYQVFKIIIFRNELPTFPRVSNRAEKWTKPLSILCKFI